MRQDTAAATSDRHSVDGPRWFESRILCRNLPCIVQLRRLDHARAKSSRLLLQCRRRPSRRRRRWRRRRRSVLLAASHCSLSHVLLAASYFLLATWQFAPPPCNLALVLANDNNRRDYDDTSFWTSQTTVGQVSSCGLETTDLKTSAYWSMPLGASIRVVLRGVGGALLGEATYPVLAQVHAYGCYE